MNEIEIEDIEVELVVDSVYRCCGYDFRNYSRASLKRRVKYMLSITDCTYISDLIPKLLYDDKYLNKFLDSMSISVTEMFRDPWVFKTIREKVLPTLKIFPQINIWHAGCSTGEEVYSMAILLKEENLLDRCQIYATDFNNNSLKIAKEGIYPIEKIKEYTHNFYEAGGESSLSDYYHEKYDLIKFDDDLKKNIVFSSHNLVTDTVFGEMNIVICRNVLIYFKQDLQNKVLTLFKDSLSSKGYLILGEKESLKSFEINTKFEEVEANEKIYRLK